MKAVHLRALSLPLLLCHSARRREMSFFRRMSCSFVRAGLSSSVTFLYCCFRDFSSFLSWVILIPRRFGLAMFLAFGCSMPNLSAPMLMIRVHIDWSRWSTALLWCSFKGSVHVLIKLAPLSPLVCGRPQDPAMFRWFARCSMWSLEVLDAVGWLRVLLLLRLTRDSTGHCLCALLNLLPPYAAHLGLVDPQTSQVLAGLAAKTGCSRCR